MTDQEEWCTRIGLSLPQSSQASIEREPLPLIEILSIFAREMVHDFTLANVCHCLQVLCFFFRRVHKKKGGGGPSIHEEAWARIFAHLQPVFDCMGPGLQPFHGRDECHSAPQHVANFQLKGRESEAAGPFEKLVCLEWHLSAT